MSSSSSSTDLTEFPRVPIDGPEKSSLSVSGPKVTWRHSRSPTTRARVIIKNRRQRYLDTHPEFFTSPSLELTDPLTYDRLIRRFQSPAEREAEGRRKGFSGVLEADLSRLEAKINALPNSNHAASMRYRRDQSGEIISEEEDEVPMSQEEGVKRWRKKMELMFVRGDDSDFNYTLVDGNEEFDDRTVQEREEEDRWFEEEEPKWIPTHQSNEQEHETTGLSGQTGVQDF